MRKFAMLTVAILSLFAVNTAQAEFAFGTTTRLSSIGLEVDPFLSPTYEDDTISAGFGIFAQLRTSGDKDVVGIHFGYTSESADFQYTDNSGFSPATVKTEVKNVVDWLLFAREPLDHSRAASFYMVGLSRATIKSTGSPIHIPEKFDGVKAVFGFEVVGDSGEIAQLSFSVARYEKSISTTLIDAFQVGIEFSYGIRF